MSLIRYEGNGRMSKAVIHNGTVYLCGQVSAGENVKDQTLKTLEKVQDLLEKYGSDKRHILSALIHIKDMSFFSDMNDVWDAWIEDGFEPVRTCVEAKMAREDLLVEVTIIAAVKDSGK